MRFILGPPCIRSLQYPLVSEHDLPWASSRYSELSRASHALLEVSGLTVFISQSCAALTLLLHAQEMLPALLFCCWAL